MKLEEMVVPRPSGVAFANPGIACDTSTLDMIECDSELCVCAQLLNDTLEALSQEPRRILPCKYNIGTRRRFAFQVNDKLGAEAYSLSVRSDTIIVTGGDAAGAFYGAQSLCQILYVCAANGGHDIFVPVGGFNDSPRFRYRGFMLDSARHFQKKEVIFKLIDALAAYKINYFHWHINDRQSWRMALDSHPELAQKTPKDHTFSFGAYSKSDIDEVRRYAEKNFMTVIPEIEMPGHSAIVFRYHPELACPVTNDPFGDDVWEYCIGNPAVKEFLSEILTETASMFPNSPIIHIGGDEAGTIRWNECPVCRKAMDDKGFTDIRDLEHDFMLDMEKRLSHIGRTAMSWGTHGSLDFSKKMIIQDWLGAETLRAVKAGNEVVNSFHCANYFDYPNEVGVDESSYRCGNYDFDPVPVEATCDEAAFVIGSEACLWTESIPSWRVLARTIPRLRPFAEMVWTPREQRKFDDFENRERRLIQSGYPY